MVKVTASFIDVYNPNEDRISEMKRVINHNDQLKHSSTECDSDSAISFDDSSDDEEQVEDMQTTIRKLKEANPLPRKNKEASVIKNERQERLEKIKKRFQTDSPTKVLSSPRMSRKQFAVGTKDVQTKTDRPRTLPLDTSLHRSYSSCQVNALCSPMFSRKLFKRQNTVPETTPEESMTRSYSSSHLTKQDRPRTLPLDISLQRSYSSCQVDALCSPMFSRKLFKRQNTVPEITPEEQMTRSYSSSHLTKTDRPRTLPLDISRQRSYSSCQVDALCSPMFSRKLFKRQNTVPEMTPEEPMARSYSSSQIHILRSPRLTRKKFTTSSKDLTPISPMQLTNNDISPKNTKPSTKSAPCTPVQDDLESPRTKRKPFDITKSTAYKEIYAHNLRLYSAVLAKQIASTGQVGREMDELRRNKNKEKALRNEQLPRSRSFAYVKPRDPSSRQERSNSAGSTDLHIASIKIRQKFLSERSQSQEDVLSENILWNNSITDCQTNSSPLASPEMSFQSSETVIRQSNSEEDDPEINSKTPPEESTIKDFRRIKSMVENDKISSPSSSAIFQARKKTAIIRSEHFRNKIRSFDETLIEANKFLNKIKTIKENHQEKYNRNS